MSKLTDRLDATSAAELGPVRVVSWPPKEDSIEQNASIISLEMVEPKLLLRTSELPPEDARYRGQLVFVVGFSPEQVVLLRGALRLLEEFPLGDMSASKRAALVARSVSLVSSSEIPDVDDWSGWEELADVLDAASPLTTPLRSDSPVPAGIRLALSEAGEAAGWSDDDALFFALVSSGAPVMVAAAAGEHLVAKVADAITAFVDGDTPPAASVVMM